MHRTRILFIVAILSLSAYAEDNWPRFRGPQATGVSQDDPRLPERWDRDDNVLWQTEVPGWGWSCPVVWGNRAFLTTVVGEEEYEKPRKGLYLGQGRRKPPQSGPFTGLRLGWARLAEARSSGQFRGAAAGSG